MVDAVTDSHSAEAPELTRTAGTAPPGSWTRPVMLEHVEQELNDLWREVSQAGGPKARSVMSNLIVYGEPGRDTREHEQELIDVSRLHPSRVIVVRHEPSADMAADLRIYTHGRGVSQFGVEHISLTTPDREAVPSLLRKLVIGNLPTTLWWAASHPPHARVVERLATLARQFIYDSGVFSDPVEGMRAIAPLVSQPGVDLDVADLAWRRMKPIREALLQALDPSVLLRDPGSVKAISVEASESERPTAWLFIGWMTSRLGWRPVQRAGDTSRALVEFQGETGRAPVKLGETSGDAELHVTIETDALADRAAFDLVSTSGDTVVRYGWDVPPLSMFSPRRRRPEMLASELRNLHVDRYLKDSLEMVGRIRGL
jgi:glucose-6-phosphate dehydrogenase assembly protein OpcA